MTAPPATGAPAATAPSRSGLVLIALILVAAVANLNLSVANVALPSIGEAGGRQWFVPNVCIKWAMKRVRVEIDGRARWGAPAGDSIELDDGTEIAEAGARYLPQLWTRRRPRSRARTCRLVPLVPELHLAPVGQRHRPRRRTS